MTVHFPALKHFRKPLVWLPFSFICSIGLSAIHYTVAVNVPDKQFTVTIQMAVKKGPISFAIPGWSPGYYQMAHYQDTISMVSAKLGETSLPVTHPSSLEWACSPTQAGTISLTYQVHAVDPGLGFFGSHIDDQTGFINGASAFMYPVGFKTNPDVLKINAPNGWKIEDPLPADSADTFEAKTGYDEMIDCPIQLGEFESKTFSVHGVPYSVLFVKGAEPIKCNMNKIKTMLQTVSGPALSMFRGAPFKNYTYIIHLKVGNFAGGLEHRNSTVIALDDDPGLDFPTIAAHENFHAWNVKRIRPFELGPFNYNQTADTSQIWWSEGVTDYYSDVLTYRSGLGDRNWLLAQISDRVLDLQHEDGRLKVTLAQCGLDTWKADGFSSGGLNYYTKGYLVGWVLDCAIRAHTHGQKSLDDVMRYLLQTYGLPQPGFKKGDLLKAINLIAGTKGGTPDSFDALYDTLVHSPVEIPYSVVRSLGLQAVGEALPEFDYPFTASASGVISDLTPAASAAGLKAGDTLVKVTWSPWNGIGPQPTDQLTVIVKRTNDSGSNQLTFLVPQKRTNPGSYAVVLDPAASDAAKALREQWFSLNP